MMFLGAVKKNACTSDVTKLEMERELEVVRKSSRSWWQSLKKKSGKKKQSSIFLKVYKIQSLPSLTLCVF